MNNHSEAKRRRSRSRSRRDRDPSSDRLRSHGREIARHRRQRRREPYSPRPDGEDRGRSQRRTPSSCGRRDRPHRSAGTPEESHREEGSQQLQVPSCSFHSNTTESKIEQLQLIVEALLADKAKEKRDHSPRLLIKPDCIPLYAPGDPNMTSSRWVEKIEQLAQINSWDEKTTIYHMQSRLTGLAKTWYYNLNDYTRTWEEWKALITKTFPDQRDFATNLRKLVDRYKLPDETWTKYYFAKMALVQACSISDENAVSCIIDGIKDSTIQIAARAGRYKSAEDLYSHYLSGLKDEEPFSKNKELLRGNRKYVPPKVYHEEKPSDQAKIKKMSNSRCFNCGLPSHLASDCPKPRKQCTNCKRLGHEASQCTRYQSPRKVLGCVTDKGDSQNCYYVRCKVDGIETEGYVDTGCSIVAIRLSDAKRLHLKWTKCQIIITGYGGGAAKALGKTTISLEVDLVKIRVDALIVGDNLQQVPVMIGQTFLNKGNVTLVLQDNKMRIFDSHLVNLPQMDDVLPEKITLCAEADVTIPPNFIGRVSVVCREEYNGEVYVRGGLRGEPNNAYLLPHSVITSPKGAVLVLNTSDMPIQFKSSQVVARGGPCQEEVSADATPVSVLSINATKHELCLTDIMNQVDSHLDETILYRLLGLLNKYRECFASNTKELGIARDIDMSINLTDNTPITYRPYRLSFAERVQVREIIQDLLDNNIIRESNSPFASPILLVKNKTGELRMCVDYKKLNAKTVKDITRCLA